MAQKRMIDKQISVSEQVANLSHDAQLIFTWSIVHSDDVGLLPYSCRTLKATIVPMWDEIKLDQFKFLIDEILKEKLYRIFEYKGEKYLQINKFRKYQSLKKDRQPQTILPINYQKKAEDTWKDLENIGFQLEDNGFHLESEEKGSEEKRREVKRSKGKILAASNAADDPVNQVFSVFYDTGVNQQINFGNNTSRKAAEWLIKKYGLEKTIRLVKYACSVQGQNFAPVITTPYQFKEKLAALAIFAKKQDNNSITKIS